jgi:hypothetical protein
MGETAECIGDLTGDLARMARDHRLHTLEYLLEMAQLEARNVLASFALKRDPGSGGEGHEGVSVARQPAGQFELQQNRPHNRRRATG